MKAYKLFRLKKNGNIGSLFIDRKADIPFNKWLEAEEIPTKGFQVRKGWHCCLATTDAPHLKMKLANGEQRIWAEVEVENYTTYDRPESQGKCWVLANKMKAIRLLEGVGHE